MIGRSLSGLAELGGSTTPTSRYGSPTAEPGQPDPYSDQTPTEEFPDDAAYLAALESRHQEWYSYRYAYEPGWYEAVAFYLGLQSSKWNYADRIIQEGKAPSYRVKAVENQIMPLVKKSIGRFFQNSPRFVSRPKNPTDQAYSDAVVMDFLIEDRWRTLNLSTKAQQVMLWGILTGTGFAKVGWDPSRGVPIDVPGYDPVAPGEVEFIPMGPLNILQPPSQIDWDGPTEVMEIRAYPIEWAKKVYGKPAFGLKADEISWQSSFEWRIASLVSPDAGAGYSARPMMEKMVYIKEWWTDPQLLPEDELKKYPNGRLIVSSQGRMLMKDRYPFDDGKHPYCYWQAELFPGRFLGASIIDQVKNPQKILNRRISQLVESADLCASPQIDVEKNHGIAKLTGEAGLVCERNIGRAAPTYRQMPAISQHVVKLIDLSKGAIQEIGGFHDISRGIPITSNLSGPTVEMLQGADNEPLLPAAQRWSSFLTQVGTKVVKRVQQFYQEERCITIVGPQNETDVMAFLAARHQTELDVVCDIDSVIPQSPASRMARVNELLRLGVLNPDKHRSTILSLYRFGNIRELFTEDDEDRQKAQRENRKLTMGQPAEVAVFDNDDIHLQVHNRLRKSPEYDRMDPIVRQGLDFHCQAHQQQLLGKAQALTMGGAPMTNQESSPMMGTGAPAPAPPPGGPSSSGV